MSAPAETTLADIPFTDWTGLTVRSRAWGTETCGDAGKVVGLIHGNAYALVRFNGEMASRTCAAHCLVVVPA